MCDLGELFFPDSGGHVAALDGLLTAALLIPAGMQPVKSPHAAVRRPHQVPGDVTDRHPHRAPPCSARASNCCTPDTGRTGPAAATAGRPPDRGPFAWRGVRSATAGGLGAEGIGAAGALVSMTK